MNSTLQLAIQAALDAGEAILSIYNDSNADFNIERKADNSPLTIADKKANERIMEYLKTSSYPIISEENKNLDYTERKSWKSLWIVDPLDGTKEFIKRNGEFTVNIALIENGTPILGVIYVPCLKRLYYGDLKLGAYKVDNIENSASLDLKKLTDNSIKLPLENQERPFTVVCSRSHMSEQTAEFIKKLEKEHKEIQLTSIGSSLKICLVAEGTADVYPRFAPTMEWDTAAGHAIVKAMGKNLYKEDETSPLEYNKENLLNPYFIVK